jgi:hypothetical protein
MCDDGLNAKYKRLFLRLGAAFMLLSIAACSSGPDIRERQATAMRMWQERCDTKAGVRIYRTAENVEGIFLMKLRPERINFDDQFALDDPYGSDSTGDWYIKNFLRGFYHQRDEKPAEGAPPRTGYRYVEAIDPADGKRYRYTGRVEEPWQYDKSYLQGYKRFVMDKATAPDKPPRYGVTYDDISTREEREYWIAGSSLKVIDLETKEVMAERIGYMVDRYQGSRAGGRRPWLFAADYACPTFQFNPLRPLTRGGGGGAGSQPGQTLIFTEKVLRPSME